MSIIDYHLQHVLRRLIDNEPSETRHQLRNIAKCGQRLIPPGIGALPVVAVLRSSDNQSALFGHVHCKNPFCCPACTAKIMEGYRAKIASAIDMQEASGEWGFMATFTIPHFSSMTCRETTDILYKTWQYFKLKLKHTDRKTNWEHPYYSFIKATGVNSWVRVCEYTYGKANGWHPHFHCIFWVPKKNFDSVLDWEEKLCDFWLSTARRIAIKYWKDNHLHESQDLETFANLLFARTRDWRGALQFSRDLNGKLLKATSANYMTGWTADRELTGNIRKEASHKNHYTPYQILEKAEFDKQWARVYIDFCLAVTRKPVHHRLNFSKNGICKRLAEWQKTHPTESTSLVKKNTWEAVTFFYADDWSKIYSENRRAPVIANILYLAQNPEHEDLLFDYIKSLGIPPKRRRPEFKSGWYTTDVVVDMFNRKLFEKIA